MRDIMLDFETTGTNGHINGVVQIGAVKFDYMTGEVGDIIDIPVQLAPDRMWDLGTMDWWRESPERLAHLRHCMATGVPAREGWQAFADWVGPKHIEPWRLWAKPITFEWAFLQSHCSQLDIKIPFHYRYARDINTHISALIGDPGANTYSINVPFEGMPHNALWDSLHDMRCLLKAKELYGHPVQAIQQ